MSTLEIIPVSAVEPSIDGPLPYDQYIHALDAIFRDHGTNILGGAGFLCYLTYDRVYGQARQDSDFAIVKPDRSWFRDFKVGLVANMEAAEDLLRRYYQGKIWKTQLHGQRHEYFFYAGADMEETTRLMEVSLVMNS